MFDQSIPGFPAFPTGRNIPFGTRTTVHEDDPDVMVEGWSWPIDGSSGGMIGTAAELIWLRFVTPPARENTS
jgi:hypothetical protein